MIRGFITLVVLAAVVGGGLYLFGFFDADKPTAKPAAPDGKPGDNPATPPKKTDDSPSSQAQPSPEAGAAFEKYLKCMAAGDNEGAREALAVAWKGDFPSMVRSKMKQDMIAINEKLLYSPTAGKDSEIYIVQQGDSLYTIAKKFSSRERAIENYQIMHFNRLQKPDQIQPGQRLKILKGTFRILVRKSTFTLTLTYNDTVVKEYKAAIGKDEAAHASPEGTFKIVERLEKPDWEKPKPKIKYGDPRNPLGEIWMGFAAPYTEFGVHGTNDPASIGTAATEGCIRLRNEDVIELYHMTAHGTEVIITK